MRDLLDSYLSDELLVETNHELLGHLGSCADCSAELERRKSLRGALAGALKVEGGTDALEERIVAAIESTDSLWNRLKPRLVWIVAAGVALAAVAVLWATMRSGGEWTAGEQASTPSADARVDDAVYRDSVTNHRQCALSYPADLRVSRALAATQLRPPYEGLLSSIDLDGVGYGLIEAHVCRNGSRTFAHVILDAGGRPASLFASRKSEGDLPPGEAVLSTHGLEAPLHEVRDQGFEAAAFETREFFVFVISELPREGNERLASSLVPEVIRFLRGIEE
jgi:anti-sigma factor RsiW